MASIAVVACCDTKYHEIEYVSGRIRALGHTPMVLDISTGPNIPFQADITHTAILKEGGYDWELVRKFEKAEAIGAMTRAVSTVISRLFHEKAISGALGMGGLQNTVMASAAFRHLPIGFPKLIVSTIASGSRYFDTVVGDKDITVVPSVVDFTGINPISESILGNAVAAVVGMVENGKGLVKPSSQSTIATTLMGITNDTVMRAIDALQNAGYQVMSFHSTGIGGRVMEDMIRSGHIQAVMDLTLHEMTAEYFNGYGYSKGANDRLTAAAEKGTPMLVCPGGIDFICLRKNELFEDQDTRGYVWHNPDLTHTRLYPREMLDITSTIIDRVNASKGPVTVLLPCGGLRTLCKQGEPFYHPEVLNDMDRMFRSKLRKNVRYVNTPYAFPDPEFSDLVVTEMLRLLEQDI